MGRLSVQKAFEVSVPIQNTNDKVFLKCFFTKFVVHWSVKYIMSLPLKPKAQYKTLNTVITVNKCN